MSPGKAHRGGEAIAVQVSASVTTKGVVLFFLFLFGIGGVLGALMRWNVYGIDSVLASVQFVVGVALIGSGIAVWKMWEE